MKLKYKKIILLTTMSTMGIGLLTLSISHDRPKAEEILSPGVSQEAGLLYAKEDIPETDALIANEITPIPTLAPTPLPTLSPEPTSLPVYDIEKDANPEIDSIFKDYFAAKNSCDVEKLQGLLSDPSQVESVEQLQKKTEYIDDYRGIKSYSKKGFEEGSYIVYVYHEIKFTSVNTPAPALSKFYLVTDNDGKLKIFSSEMDPEVQAYFTDRNKDADVKKLIKSTNKKGEDAKAKDEDLQKFWENIDNMVKENQKSAKAEGDTAE